MNPPKRQIWGSHLSEPPDRLMLEFCAGRDVAAVPMADALLIPFDLWTNRAHVIMLGRQGILPAGVAGQALRALAELEAEWDAGRFTLKPELEDVHVNVERFVSERAGA